MDGLCQSLSSGVASRGNFPIFLLRWAPPPNLIRYIVLVVGGLKLHYIQYDTIRTYLTSFSVQCFS